MEEGQRKREKGRERERERERGRESQAGSPMWGSNSQTVRSRPEPKPTVGCLTN